MPAAAPLRARDLTVTRGPLTVLDAVDLVVAGRPAHRRRRPQRRRQVDAAAGARRAVPLERGRVERTPPTATVGYLPQEPSRSRRDRARVPRPPHRASPRRPSSWTPPRPRSPPATPAPTTATPSPLDRWLALGGADLDARVGQVWADLGLRRPAARPADRRRCRAARRRAPGWPRCCSPASTCSCSTSRRTTSTSTGSTGSSAGSPSSPAGVVLVSHDRTFLARTVTDVARARRVHPPRRPRYGGGWQAYLDEREVGPAGRVGALRGVRHQARGRSPGGPSGSGSGRRRACPRRRSPTSRTRTSAPSRSTRPSSSPAGRRARSGRSSGSTRSTSRASRGSCGSPWPRPGAAATSSPASTAPSSSGARSRSGRSTSSSATGERIALVGANGSGKTTLLDALLGPRRARRRARAPSGRASSSARSSRPATG